jgi:gas vesicle protein
MGSDVSNNSENNRNQKSAGRDLFDALIIILVSIFSGYMLGLLFAPQSGLKTRKKVVEKLKELIDRGKFALAEAKVLGEELLSKGKEKVSKARKDVP